MDNAPFISYAIEERSYVSYVKREIHNLVKSHYTVQRTGEIDIIVSELTSNMIKHAGKGELLYRVTITEDGPTFEVVAIDHGPGIKDVSLVMRDGISSTNTLGHGLGSLNRMSNMFQVYSQLGRGCVFYSRVLSEKEDDFTSSAERQVTIGALSVSKPGEKSCGDGYYVSRSDEKLTIFLGDGLGHGEHAHEAVEKAISSFKGVSSTTNLPSEMLKEIHTAVKRTRGLVATVAVLNLDSKTLRLCGVGNITSKIFSGIVLRSNISYNGILGLNIPSSMSNLELVLEKYQTLIMCSDGIKTRWDLAQYGGLLKYDPMVIAAVIYKDHARKTDDMSILVARIK